MTRRFLVLFLPLLALGASACSSLAVAAATIDGEKITEAQVESELDTLRQDPVFGEALRRDPEERGKQRQQIVTELIYQTVMDKAARDLGITVTSGQIENFLQQAADARGVSVAELLRSENLTREEANKLAERNVLRFALINRVVRDLRVDDADVRDVYKGQQDRFVEVTLERITVRREDDATEVLEALDDGEDFDDLARERSTDAFADQGGRMAPTLLTALDVQVQGALASVVEGGVSDPIEGASGGFEIYRLVERRTQPFNEVESGIRQSLSQEQRDTAFNRWLTEQVRKAKIVVNPKYGRFDEEAAPPAVVPSTSELTE